jgi:PAS domain S-box-containing protein
MDPQLELVALRAELAELRAELRATRARVAELEETGGGYRQLFEDNPQPMWIFEVDTLRILAVNDAAVATYGYSRSEFLELTILDLRAPDERPRLREFLAAHADRPYANLGIWEHRTKDGRSLEVELTSHQIRYAGQAARLVIVHDVTVQRTAERELAEYRENLERLVESRSTEREATSARLRFRERIASLGTLSAGLAHDMGNLLLPLRLRLETLQAGDLSPAARRELAGIQALADYLKRLVTGLRLLSADPRAAAPGAQPTQIGPWWQAVEPVFRNLLPRRFAFQADLRACFDVRVAIAEPTLTRALFKLMQHAADELQGAQTGQVTLTSQCRDGELVLMVTDSGEGMSEEAQRRALDPGEWRRAEAHAVGLGLSLAHDLIAEAGGRLEIAAESGAGSAVSLHLPLAEAEGGHAGRAAVLLGNLRRRAFVAAELRRLGYRVLGRDEAAEPDIVVTDSPVVLPDGQRLVTVPEGAPMSEIRAILREALAA